MDISKMEAVMKNNRTPKIFEVLRIPSQRFKSHILNQPEGAKEILGYIRRDM